MSIKTIDLINDALRDINVISEVDDASAEQGKYALRKLNQMMELWKEQDLDLGYFAQPNTSGDCPIPDWAESAVTAALSLRLAPKYGASVPLELVSYGADDYETILRKSLSEKLDNADLSFLPEGTGHWGNRWDINTDN